MTGRENTICGVQCDLTSMQYHVTLYNVYNKIPQLYTITPRDIVNNFTGYCADYYDVINNINITYIIT